MNGLLIYILLFFYRLLDVRGWGEQIVQLGL